MEAGRLRGYRRLGVAVAALLLAPARASGSGFQINEHSARLTGTAYAGTAALAEDASMGFFNPAGITRVRGGSIAGTLTVIDTTIDLQATSATTFGRIPVTGPDGSMEADGGTTVPVPSFHVAQRLADQWVAGFSVTAPYGAKVNYPDDSVVRYIATLTQLVTYNLNPYVAYEPVDGFSIGVGFNAQELRAHLNQKLYTPVGDVNAIIFAKDWTYGWNAGLLYELDAATRIGFAYRSQMSHTLTGPVDVYAPNGNVNHGNVRAGITFPDTYTLSGVLGLGLAGLSDEWQLAGDLVYTHWARFQKLSASFDPPVLPADEVFEDFRDTWRGTIGAIWRPDDRWTLRAGTGFDQAPVSDVSRTVRIPDANRVFLALGFGYRVWEKVYVDFGYLHAFLASGTVDETNQTPDQSNVQGRYDDDAADVFAFQLTYDWDRVPWEVLGEM
jgi:long-chain fatty acid transport protein